MRSLETGRPMLRATNDGVTALIAHDGTLLGTLPQFEPGVLTGTVEPRTGLDAVRARRQRAGAGARRCWPSPLGLAWPRRRAPAGQRRDERARRRA